MSITRLRHIFPIEISKGFNHLPHTLLNYKKGNIIDFTPKHNTCGERDLG